MLWKCTALCLLGNRIAQKSIGNAWYKFTADLSGGALRLAPRGINRQSQAQQGGSLQRARHCPCPLELSLEFKISLACRHPAYLSMNTVKEKKVGAFKTMPSWVTWICLWFFLCCQRMLLFPARICFLCVLQKTELWLLWELDYKNLKISIF